MLAPFFWMQPSMWLGLITERAHCWTCCPCWLPRTFTTKLFSSGLPASAVRWSYSVFGFHEDFFRQFIQPVEVPRKGNPALQCVDHFLQLGVIHRISEGPFHPIHSQYVKCSTDIKQHQPNISPWGLPLILANSWSLHYKTLFFQLLHTTSFPQTALCSSPIQSISLQLGYQETVGDHAESLAKGQENNIHCSPFVRWR